MLRQLPPGARFEEEPLPRLTPMLPGEGKGLGDKLWRALHDFELVYLHGNYKGDDYTLRVRGVDQPGVVVNERRWASLWTVWMPPVYEYDGKTDTLREKTPVRILQAVTLDEIEKDLREVYGI